MRSSVFVLVKLLPVVGLLAMCLAGLARTAEDPVAWHAEIADVRQVSGMIPGARPLRVNVIKIAESRRPKNFAVKGSPAEPSIQARTAYQIVYSDGTIIVDTGMDLATHKMFGRGAEEPYFPEAQARLADALQKAKAIIVTHEHGDHVGGLVKSPVFDMLAPKAILTRSQLETLMNNPQFPELRVTPAMAVRLRVIDYNQYMAFAPGIALIKAPGHTPGSQMVYVALQSGKELLLAGDVAWHMDAVRLKVGKDAPWIKEPPELMSHEIDWLSHLAQTERNLSIVISHDEDQRLAYIKQGVLGDELE